MASPNKLEHLLSALPSGHGIRNLSQELSEAALDRLVMAADTLEIHLSFYQLPKAEDLIAMEEELAKPGLAPKVLIYLKPARSFDSRDRLKAAASLFPWMLETLRYRHGFLALILSTLRLEIASDSLLLYVPREMISCFTSEVLEECSRFMAERAGISVEFGIRAIEIDQKELIRKQTAMQQANISKVRRRVMESTDHTDEIRVIGENGEPVLESELASKNNGNALPSHSMDSSKSNSPINGSSAEAPKRNYRQSVEGRLWGKLNPDLTVTAIKTYTAESSYVQMEGSIHDLEGRIVSNGTRLLYKFSVYDADGAINCILFARLEEKETLDAILEKKGAYYRFEAEISYDAKFAKDLQATIRGIKEATAPEGRKDEWPEKRVELHCHSKMSSKDAISDVSNVVKLAAKFGHPAVAITDHGVVQSFPEACDTRDSLRKSGKNIKLIYGVEGYLINDGKACVYGMGDLHLGDSFVALDLETTGLDPSKERIIEIGAIRYRRKAEGGFVETERYSTLVNPGRSLSDEIIKLTGLTDMDLAGGMEPWEAIKSFHEWLGGDSLVGHNILFDLGFLRYEGFRTPVKNGPRVKFNPTVIDTLELARHMLPHMNRHRLDMVAARLGIEIGNHHRALDDAATAAEIFLKLYEEAGCPDLPKLNRMLGQLTHDEVTDAKRRPNHIIFLVKDDVGLYNLYRLVSESHTRYFRRRPRIPRSLLDYLRTGLIIGAACEAGEVFQYVHKEYIANERNFDATLAAVRSWPAKQLARYYDYLEIQPIGNNRFMISKEGTGIQNEDDLMNLNRLILEMGKAAAKAVAATCDSHFLNESDGIYRQVMQAGIGFEDTEEAANLYFRNTEEMLLEFAYLGTDQARESVISVPNYIASLVEDDLKPFPAGTYPPVIDEAADFVTNLTWSTARGMYEKNGVMPAVVTERIERELSSIIDNGFAIMYYISHKLVKKSNDDGYIVGSRGSVGSSVVATFCGITEVNPLPAHYYCPNCQYTHFYDSGEYGSGYDMPSRPCPDCSTELKRDGQDIPFETFLGFNGDKQPDIDLNFSGEYQPRAHRFIEEMFGEEHTFRAGTIGAYAEKNALGLVRGYLEQSNRFATEAEKKRLAEGLVGVKRTTGQHPGGIVVIPKDREIYDFTPIQYPADKADAGVTTTHFDFNAMHDTILKLDILGHDDPTMLKFLHDETGVNPMDIPIPDERVMSLFQSTEALGIEPGTTTADCATLGLPEMGTFMARDMIQETKPTKFYDLVQLMGLSHGTDVWKGNAQELIANGTCTIDEVIGCRDGIMTTLIHKGLPAFAAFDIMEKVRKGKGVSPEYEALMREHNVEEWYIDSCKKIKYMFPKAHAVAYVISTLRIAWYKVNYPEAYYAAYFTVRADEFDCTIMGGDLAHTIRERERLRGSFSLRDGNAREQRQYYITELVEEMLHRGIKLLPIDLYESQASRFEVVGKGLIRTPFDALPNFSTSMGEQVVAARAEGKFMSKEDLAVRAGLGQSAIMTLSEAGVLDGLPDSAQMDFFGLLE